MNVCFSTLRNLLGNLKDKPDTEGMLGIYKIACGDCDKTYIGQTKWTIGTRFKEHVAHHGYGRIEL